MNILIFAGGSGTRLWPASRKSKPKQLLKLIDNKTLLQNTYDRCLQWTKKNQIYIATLSEYKDVIRKQLPGIPVSHYSLEPAL
ncbi:MAG TPA: sugar phosphate nucleotidyltransferase, partial [Patescibacteria group bacterium]|nr:sugar phosphate nucleotidyltransferase [Patescibacteria group bacterium]